MTLLSRRLVKGVFACCLIVAVAAALFYKEAAATQLQRLNILPQPERLTELYFSEPATLSRLSKVGSQLLSFTIHSLEHRPTVYTYQLFVHFSATKRLLKEGHVMLAHNEARRMAESVAELGGTDASIIEVRLNYQGIPPGRGELEKQMQTISYRVR
ncbi:MAG TPA: hypothetical protein VFZ58_04385 [Candidatus Saccharimonadales bacterium]